MIKSVTLENFQSHKKTKLSFSSGVNVIVGTSDSGKTAILRGIRLVAENRPSGDSSRSTWGGKTSVSLEVEIPFGENDCTITRVKDKAEEYWVGKTQFKAFGVSVPTEVTDTLNMGEVNLQSQMDSPFLISSTPGAVAAHFNKIAKLDKIDTATSNINSWIRDLNSSIKYLKEDEQKKLAQLEEFAYLEKMEIKIEVLEEMENQSISLGRRCNQLSNLIDKIYRIDSELEGFESVIPMSKDLDRLLDLKENEKRLYANKERLSWILESIRENNLDMNMYSARLPMGEDIEKLLTMITDLKPMNNLIVNLRNLIIDIQNINLFIISKEQNAEGLQKDFEEEIGDVCPLCDSPIKHEH